MPSFRRILERLDEYLLGVPNKDITAEHFDQLEPEAQKNLTDHVANNPKPIFVKDDAVQAESPAPEPVAEVAPVSEPAPVEAAPVAVADDSGQVAPA